MHLFVVCTLMDYLDVNIDDRFWLFRLMETIAKTEKLIWWSFHQLQMIAEQIKFVQMEILNKIEQRCTREWVIRITKKNLKTHANVKLKLIVFYQLIKTENVEQRYTNHRWMRIISIIRITVKKLTKWQQTKWPLWGRPLLHQPTPSKAFGRAPSMRLKSL